MPNLHQPGRVRVDPDVFHALIVRLGGTDVAAGLASDPADDCDIYTAPQWPTTAAPGQRPSQ